jgi:cytochrome c553
MSNGWLFLPPTRPRSPEVGARSPRIARTGRSWEVGALLTLAGCWGLGERGSGPALRGSSDTANAPTGGAVLLGSSSRLPLVLAEDAPPARVGALFDGAALPRVTPSDSWKALCARRTEDPASVRLCAAPQPRSLTELTEILGLGFHAAVGNGELGNPAFALLSHSTSLTGHLVSPLNPRVFLFSAPHTEGPIGEPGVRDPDMIALAYARGEPLVEVVSRDRRTGELVFLLLRVELTCETELATSAATDGCDSWDLFGPEVETGWRAVSAFADADLENTIFDCNVCHREGGPGTEKRLLMMQQRPPWTHFFRDKEAGALLLDRYFTAHPREERYGTVPGTLVRWSEPALLEGLVEHEGFVAQPTELPTRDLARAEMRRADPHAVTRYAELQVRALSGGLPPVPDARAFFFDPVRADRLAKDYRARAKDPSAPFFEPAELHDGRALVATLRRGAPDASGDELLLAACSRCHNDRLDPSLSRARFDVTALDAMSDAELGLAIERLAADPTATLAMPPPRYFVPTADERAKMRAALVARMDSKPQEP